ncbi:hypothetical protein [Synechocystis sp. LKSZ1]|uniref:hypothetical protein n=1 Tax=Synechocystis sp. LKSZ1 TaxID=3144951 RepID=UPI00336BB2B2
MTNLLRLASASLLSFVTVAYPLIPSQPLQAETPPAETFRPGFWQPVARFNPNQAVTLQIINKSGVELDYDITTLESPAPHRIAIGASETVREFGNAAYIMVYPVNADFTDKPFTLSFQAEVKTATNQVIVTVTKAEPSFLGHRTINLQNTGAIYFY